MAKLEGVKTLDMVNGEITKVAYGGAAYERVEGEAKAGDIVRLVDKEDFHSTPGGFYDVIAGGRSAVCVLDDYGAHHNWTEGWYELFRKVAANTNPSVEDRVTKAEGEIESLKSDVAALKGEAEYKRIAKSEARAGDYVKFDDPPSYLTDKEYYEIKEFDDGDPVIIDDDNDEYDTYIDNFEVYRKVSASSVETEPKPERLKVGDYAKVVGQAIITEKGDIVKIIQDTGGQVPFMVETMDGKETEWRTEESLVRATDEEVAEAKRAAARAKFKRGDKVRLKSGGEKFPLSGFSDGGVYTVMYNDFNHLHGKRIRIADGTEGFGYATPDQLEILSEEEAAEIERKQAEEAKWAEIGREVGEYKEGDVVAYDDPTWFQNSGIGEVIELMDGIPCVLATNSRGSKVPIYVSTEQVKLITPVEARFDR